MTLTKLINGKYVCSIQLLTHRARIRCQLGKNHRIMKDMIYNLHLRYTTWVDLRANLILTRVNTSQLAQGEASTT